jgi:hypothetical protein
VLVAPRSIRPDDDLISQAELEVRIRRMVNLADQGLDERFKISMSSVKRLVRQAESRRRGAPLD